MVRSGVGARREQRSFPWRWYPSRWGLIRIGLKLRRVTPIWSGCGGAGTFGDGGPAWGPRRSGRRAETRGLKPRLGECRRRGRPLGRAQARRYPLGLGRQRDGPVGQWAGTAPDQPRTGRHQRRLGSSMLPVELDTGAAPGWNPLGLGVGASRRGNQLDEHEQLALADPGLPGIELDRPHRGLPGVGVEPLGGALGAIPWSPEP